MYRLLENHGKKLLIFVGVGLMIVFILPPAAMQGGTNPTIGELPGGIALRAGDLQTAEARLNRLNALFIPAGQQGAVPALVTLFPTTPQQLWGQRMGAFTSDPLLLQLALFEADQRNVSVSADALNQTLESDVFRFRGQGGLIAYSETDAETGEAFRGAVADLLQLQALRSVLVSGTVHVSKPLREAQAVQAAVQLTTEYHVVDAEPMLAAVEDPSDQDLRAFFDEYSATQPGTVTDENPLGVGYRLQDRVKLQYFTVSRAAVREAVLAEKDDFEWQTQWNKTYIQNRNRWASAVADANAEEDAEAEDPTVGPQLPGGDEEPEPEPLPDLTDVKFADLPEPVQEQIREATLAPLVTTKLDQVLNLLRNQMTNDAQANRAAARTGAEPKVPDLDSFSYMQTLADDAEKRFDVRPGVISLADRFRDGEALQALDGIGGSFAGQFPQVVPFARVALANEGVLEGTPQAGNGLPILASSTLLSDLPGETYYLFRVTETAKAEPATDLDAVRGEVVDDWKRTQALRQAVEQAAEIAAGGFVGVETTTADQVSVYAPVRLAQVADDEADQAGAEFLANLLRSWTRGNDSGGVPLPSSMSAAAFRVTTVNTIYEDTTAKAGLLRRADRDLRQALLGGNAINGFDATWLTEESLFQRTGYVSTRPRNDEPEEQAESDEEDATETDADA